jgi:pimeloyl-ACP methyl ester carboxylesterase
MTKNKPHLIIIPGLGDDKRVVRLAFKIVAKLFWNRRFFAHVYIYGWNSEQNHNDALESLRTYANELPQPATIYVIGISAGGSAAVNLLATNPAVRKVVTICAPYTPITARKNRLFDESVKLTDKYLSKNPDIKRKIVSVYNRRDPVVPPTSSQPDGIRTVAVSMKGHAKACMLLLTMKRKIINQFFDKRKLIS